MFSEKRKFGNIGEDLACRFLMKRGFSVIERNFLRKCGEIDIVAKKGNQYHFVEVKTVSCQLCHSYESASGINHMQRVTLGGNGQVPCVTTGIRPEENVHPAKLAKMARTIEVYLLDKGVSSETLWQIDVVCVYLDLKRKEAKVKLIENIVI